jgi:hypothetical protein
MLQARGALEWLYIHGHISLKLLLKHVETT